MVGVVVAPGGIAHVNRTINAQTVYMIFSEPHRDVVKDELAYFRPPVVGSSAPRRIAALVVIKINAAAIILTPAVKAPQICITVKMVVYNVENDTDTVLMAGVHELHQSMPSAEHTFDTENMIWCVAPTITKCHARDRHKLNNIDTEIAQVIKFFDCRIKCAGSCGIGTVECANMQFVNNVVALWRHYKIVALPVEFIVDNY